MLRHAKQKVMARMPAYLPGMSAYNHSQDYITRTTTLGPEGIAT